MSDIGNRPHDDTNHQISHFSKKVPDFIRKQFKPAARDMHSTITENTTTIQNLANDIEVPEVPTMQPEMIQEKSKEEDLREIIQNAKETASRIQERAEAIIRERAPHKAMRQKFGDSEQRDAYREAARLKKDLKGVRNESRERRETFEPRLKGHTNTIRETKNQVEEYLRGEDSRENLQMLRERTNKKDFAYVLRAVADEYRRNFNELFESNRGVLGNRFEMTPAWANKRVHPPTYMETMLSTVEKQRRNLGDNDIHGFMDHLDLLEKSRGELLRRELTSIRSYCVNDERRRWWSIEDRSTDSHYQSMLQDFTELADEQG